MSESSPLWHVVGWRSPSLTRPGWVWLASLPHRGVFVAELVRRAVLPQLRDVVPSDLVRFESQPWPSFAAAEQHRQSLMGAGGARGARSPAGS